jgi:hypothetical protein
MVVLIKPNCLYFGMQYWVEEPAVNKGITNGKP